MNYVADLLIQKNKTGHMVCGDYSVCERTPNGTYFIVCDGVGSGIYANIAAITCAQRILEHLRLGTSLRKSCEMVASSMHRARMEKVPFAAFSAAMIGPDNHFTVYTYEAPNPVYVQSGRATVLVPRMYTAGYEVIGEHMGKLRLGDYLLLMSDGVTQAGMGRGYLSGIGSEGIADFITRAFRTNDDIETLMEKIIENCAEINGGKYEDDTTLAILHARVPIELTMLTGPPSDKNMDYEYANIVSEAVGRIIVCGSTTMHIVARELNLAFEPLPNKNNPSAPPEFFIEGIDLATEGAITLNQVYNVLGDELLDLERDSSVKRMCMMLQEADIVHMHIGNAVNDAHENLLFKQVGVRVRKTIIGLIADKLRQMGKLVIETYH
ncbi:MAG: SpoIIE family protein phosphatase [Oscillospiraceae bacterium]|nr:SpoIIE family protein phosphatase [Oscillospiraceae bacterium]